MQCRSCGYNLWNIGSRQCPECGKEFAPSQYDFAPYSVKYLCKHCQQQYYGTSPRGHLDPPEFECVSCHKPVVMDEMVLLPAQGVSEQQTRMSSNPWLDRLNPERRIGLVSAWWKTLGYSLGRPSELMRATPDEAPVSQALLFFVMTSLIFWISGAGTMLAFFVFSFAFSMRSPGSGSVMLGPAWGMVFMFGGLLVAVLVGTPVWAGITHLLLRLGGKTPGGYGRTLSCLCYSVGGNILTAVPCLGCSIGLFSIVWWTVSATLMVREGKRVGGGRASFATITPPLVVAVLGLSGYIGFIFFAVSAATGARGAAIAGANQQVAMMQSRGVALAMLSYSQGNNDAGPDHFARLILNNPTSGVSSWQLVYPGSGKDPAALPFGGSTLGQAEALAAAQRSDLTEPLIASDLAAGGVTAYRFGDYVFCDAGVKYAASANAGAPAWIFILPPDPSRPASTSITIGPSGTVTSSTTTTSPTGPPPPGSYIVGKSDGTVVAVPAITFSATLEVENQRRAGDGLRPIPPPEAFGFAPPVVPVTPTPPAPGVPGGPPADGGEKGEPAPEGQSEPGGAPASDQPPAEPKDENPPADASGAPK